MYEYSSKLCWRLGLHSACVMLCMELMGGASAVVDCSHAFRRTNWMSKRDSIGSDWGCMYVSLAGCLSVCTTRSILHTVPSYRTVQLTDSTVPKRKALFRAQSDDVALILLVRMDLTSPPIVDGHRSASLHGYVIERSSAHTPSRRNNKPRTHLTAY